MLARGTPWFIFVPPAFTAGFFVPWYQAGFPFAWHYLVLLTVLILLSFFVLFFFRDPERPTAEGLVAPAHGRVLGVKDEDGRTRVSIFMSPLDVHVVRVPLDGTVVSMERSGSGFHSAFRPEADRNVQLELRFEGGEVPFTVVMISGLVARRIVPYVSVGDAVSRGSRIGLIRFGSRVDVMVPKDAYSISVEPGAHVKAGSSSLGVRSS